MSLSNALINTGVILFIAAMTIMVFCSKQREATASPDAQAGAPPPLFNGDLAAIMPEEQANRVLVTTELFGEMLFMLAMTTGIAGIGLSMLEGLGELFRRLLQAIKRLFMSRNQAPENPTPDDPNEDMGQSMVSRPLAPSRPIALPARPPINRSQQEGVTGS